MDISHVKGRERERERESELQWIASHAKAQESDNISIFFRNLKGFLDPSSRISEKVSKSFKGLFDQLPKNCNLESFTVPKTMKTYVP